MISGSAATPETLNGFEVTDLDEAQAHAESALSALRGASLFITGGTGFFGQWLLALLARVQARVSNDMAVTVLTRDVAGFRDRCPDLAGQPFIRLLAGDVRSFEFPPGRFTHLIHAATDTSAVADQRPQELTDTILGGARRAMDFARSRGISRVLFISSGAVYGPQPFDVPRLPEEFSGAKDTTISRTVYGEAKLRAERIAKGYADVSTVIARGFAFVGPGLPLDGHFAIGNFIRDALAGRPIAVNGDGRPVRSYLYAGDLAAWLLHLLVRGRPGEAYNVGSDRAISVAELASLVARLLPGAKGVAIRGEPAAPKARSRYVPAIERVRNELGLEVWTPLEEAIRRTARWAVRRRPGARA